MTDGQREQRNRKGTIAMKKRTIVVLAIIVILCGSVIVLRRHRLEPDLIALTCTKAGPDAAELHYRAMFPFELTLHHGMREPSPHAGQIGVFITSTKHLRPTEEIAAFASRYDVLRGVHYVNIRLTPGQSLSVSGNGETVAVAPWSVPDASRVKWRFSTSTNEYYPDGLGDDIAYFSKTAEAEEYLMLIIKRRYGD